MPDRRGQDRRRAPRRAEDRQARIQELAAFGFAICGGLVIVYIFFALIGAVDPLQAVVASVVALVLALVWLVGYWQRRRATAGRAVAPGARERRGF
ncbi:MAG: hypothetical protein H0V29_11215 [Thermoleophilaceae bacterium]|nr:hypothetical protein [Thermoleophilaceae bacterium]